MTTNSSSILGGQQAQYIHLDSKLLGLLFCFAELVQTGFLVEQHAATTGHLISAQTSQEAKSKRVAKSLLSNIYTVTTGTKAKRQQLQQGQNFRGSTLSEGSSNVGLLRGAAFGIQQEFMQFKNSLLEGKANISDAKQKRKR